LKNKLGNTVNANLAEDTQSSEESFLKISCPDSTAVTAFATPRVFGCDKLASPSQT